jgi:hypothetical protein
MWSSKPYSKPATNQAFDDSLHNKSQNKKSISQCHSSPKDVGNSNNKSYSLPLELKEKSNEERSPIKVLPNRNDDSDEDIFGCVFIYRSKSVVLNLWYICFVCMPIFVVNCF